MKKKKLESLKDFNLEVLKSEQAIAITGGDGECNGTETKYEKLNVYLTGPVWESYNDWNDEGCC